MVALLKADTRPALVPAFHTRRRPERDTFGPRIKQVFELLTGFEAMPWQIDFWDIVGEKFTDQECADRDLPTGVPAYREIGLGVPRRASKTTSSFAVLVDQSTRNFTEPNRVPKSVYSAQTGNDARKKFLRDFMPWLKGPNVNPVIRKRIDRVLTANGGEAAMFKNGAGIYLGGNTAESDHGQDYDTAVIDEAFADEDNRREAAISPGQLSMDFAQRIVTSTAGTAESLYWNGICKAGRAAVEADTGEGVAYIEYSIPDGASIFDEDLWWGYHPALGYSINPTMLRFEIHKLAANEEVGGEMEACRAYGNRPTVRIFSQHIPTAIWEAVCEPRITAKGEGPHRWSYDVADDRSMSAIACHNIATGVTALTDYQAGTDWVEAKLEEHRKEHPGGVVYDATGPGANIGDKHKDWLGLNAAQNTQAFSDFMDAVTPDTRTIRVRADERLDLALAGAEIRSSSDTRKWSRSRSKVDVCPLIAVTNVTVCDPPTRRKSKPFII